MGDRGLQMHPLLLCPLNSCGRSATLPDVRGDTRPLTGDIKCAECGEDMMLVTYGIVETVAQWPHLRYHRADGTWWR